MAEYDGHEPIPVSFEIERAAIEHLARLEEQMGKPKGELVTDALVFYGMIGARVMEGAKVLLKLRDGRFQEVEYHPLEAIRKEHMGEMEE